MQIALILDPDRLQRWHTWLLDALSARGLNAISLRWAPSPTPRLPPGLELLLRLERRTGRAAAPSALDPLPSGSPAFARASQIGTAAALTIDLRGAAKPPDTTALVPLYDGTADVRALWLALLGGRAPEISVAGGGLAAPVTMALPALELPANLHSAATMTFARVAEALAIAAHALTSGQPIEPRMRRSLAQRDRPRGTVFGFATNLVSDKLQRMLDHRLDRTPAWSVAYRTAPAGRTHPPLALDMTAFTRLPDDGHRYYADPFLFQQDGALHLFVEELPFATGRGIISHSVLGPDGHFTPPRPVLERPYHLSYPQVFAHGGEVWMLPETSASGAIELYRAAPFPSRFELHARLVEGSYHDATLFEHGGRFWIAAGSVCAGSATWDSVSLFHAERLTGPWIAHPLNPVVVDARCARPAGALYRHDGALWRPSQDCSGGYGSALSLARVDLLSPEAFSETHVATYRLDGTRRRGGPHTINFAGDVEVIDAFVPRDWDPKR